ncbi:MAG: RES family NAD+ phosphorylase [Chitinophagales bacterium]
MEVFRISSEKYAKALTASGAANRWNYDHQFVLYTGSSRSLATLELVVHRASIQADFQYKIMVISIADNDSLYTQLKIDDLPKDWRQATAYAALQKAGAKWYQSDESLVLKVPSVIIPLEYNYIINTSHPDFKSNVKLVRLEDYFWDKRLF